MNGRLPPLRGWFLAAALALAPRSFARAAPAWLEGASARLETELGPRYGPRELIRLRRGVGQAASLWRDSDGDSAAFEAFARAHFAGEPKTLDALFDRFGGILESIAGHMNGITLALRESSDLDRGPVLAFDELFAAYAPAAHLVDDWFDNKLAFVALLNFPLTTLEERLADGPSWTRRQWAEARLAQQFSKRVPAEVELEIRRARSRAESYIAGYNIWMHHVLDRDGRRLFPADKRLLSHWNLRDEIKASYADARDGRAKQRLIQRVMERIVDSTIPQAVIDNPAADWDPRTNEVRGERVDAAPEQDRRYAMILDCFRAERKADPFSPAAPTLIARRFDEERQIPEKRFQAMLEQVLSSPLAPRTARLIRRRLGRPLEPFDLWYDGFSQRSSRDPVELDGIVARKYPDAEAYRKDIPALLTRLGFSRERADDLAGRILVDPARGSGHAWGPMMREQPARLRTRIEKDGMNYKGYNIAVHEMGHNVEQLVSLYDIDFTLLQGVPNNAFTEALAFVFQGHDLELLGLPSLDERARSLKTLNDFWATYEIAGVALVDMEVWRWLYEHPQASAGELKDAALRIARGVWNRYYAPVFGARDVTLLGIYSHMVEFPLYLPDYPLGHMIAFQIEEKMEKAGGIGPEFERMAREGNVSPDLWMIRATGSPVGPEALLRAADKALRTAP